MAWFRVKGRSVCSSRKYEMKPSQGGAPLTVGIYNFAVSQRRMCEQCMHYTCLAPLVYRIV